MATCYICADALFVHGLPDTLCQSKRDEGEGEERKGEEEERRIRRVICGSGEYAVREKEERGARRKGERVQRFLCFTSRREGKKRMLGRKESFRKKMEKEEESVGKEGERKNGI